MKKFWILPLALLAFSCGSGVSEAELEVWNGEITRSFPIWDPMGSLAL